MTERKYSLAKFMFGNQEIVCTKFTTGDKVEVEKYEPCNTKYAYEATPKRHELTWELEEVHPQHRVFFDTARREQDKSTYKPPEVTCYDYDETDGSLRTMTRFTGVYIEEMSKEVENSPFSVSGIACKEKDVSKKRARVM